MSDPDSITAEIHAIRAKLMEEAGGDFKKYSENARVAAELLGFKPLTVEQSRALVENRTGAEIAVPAGTAKSA